MSTITRTNVSDLRGAARLAFDATLGITTLVEKMHHTIQLVHPPLGASRAESTRGLTGLIYRSIRGTTRVIGKGLDAGLAPVAALLPEGESSTSRNAWVSAINGVYGDHLERTANPLAIEMSFLHEGDFVDPERPGDVVQDASGKVLLAIHGLCLNEQHWIRDGHHRIANVATATDHTIVHLRYNSGRSIDANGRNLAESLEALLAHWPVPVSHLVIVGHSMGGLVARSAMHHGTAAGHSWRGRLRKLFSLGTPHHGAPLERGGNRLDYVMELSPYVAPFTSLGKARSAGITDLRYGSITGVASRSSSRCRTTWSAMRWPQRSASAAACSPKDWSATVSFRSTARSASTPTARGHWRCRRSGSGSATRWGTSNCSAAPKCIRSWRNGCSDVRRALRVEGAAPQRSPSLAHQATQARAWRPLNCR